MTQNTSHAVMAQRHEPTDSIEDFPTPPWATRALLEHVLIPHCMPRMRLLKQTVWEPSCNRGYMAKPLGEYFEVVAATDIADYGWSGQDKVLDFLGPTATPTAVLGETWADWVISNPPFNLAEEFIGRAFVYSRYGFAMLVRSTFAEGIGRYNRLFRDRPPSIDAQFVERVPMQKGRVNRKGKTATAYSWMVWSSEITVGATKRLWIPPCRNKLEMDSDYD